MTLLVYSYLFFFCSRRTVPRIIGAEMWFFPKFLRKQNWLITGHWERCWIHNNTIQLETTGAGCYHMFLRPGQSNNWVGATPLHSTPPHSSQLALSSPLLQWLIAQSSTTDQLLFRAGQIISQRRTYSSMLWMAGNLRTPDI